jgi:hypothetical protein
MLYRKLGSADVDVSALGFGCMRLPVIDGKPDRIDHPAATEMLHYAIDHGVNYVDTAYFYHAETFGQPGQSEPFVGEALSGGWRERVNLATKLPLWFIKETADFEKYLHEQLGRLQTDHLDFYLLHGMNGDTWDRMKALGVIEFLDKAKQDGLIGHPAFSFHGPAEDFPRIIDAYDGWAFGQMQYNYMDIEYQAGHAGLKYAADKGIGVVVMEPLKGGKLAANLPEDMAAVLDSAHHGWSPVESALRFVWNEPGVSLLLSGMNTMEQVMENVEIADRAIAGSLTEADMAVYAEARRVMAAKIKADCTACRYCMPCPSGVDIPGVMAALNAASMWGDPNPWMCGYVTLQGKASLCTECEQCLEMCPQGLQIPELMAEAVATFENAGRPA